jgi:hypothetical protein
LQARQAGATEWFRGALDILERESDALQASGLRLHAPARTWLGEALKCAQACCSTGARACSRRSIPDFSPSLALRSPTTLERTLCNALDAYDAFGIDPVAVVPERVLRWWREARRR